MRKGAANAFGLLFLLSTLTACGWFYLAFLHAQIPVVYKNLPFPVLQKRYKPGDRIQFVVEACRDKQYPFTVNAALADGYIINFAPLEMVGMQKGCRKMITSDYIVPLFTPPGTYKVTGVNVFHVNPYATRRVQWETESFTVTAK